MGMSIRAAQALRKMQLERKERRASAGRRLEAARAEFHRNYLNRQRTAAALGISTHGLKRMMAAGRGPAPVKMGEARQSRTFWERAEIDRYLRNPAAYEAAKRAEPPQVAGYR